MSPTFQPASPHPSRQSDSLSCPVTARDVPLRRGRQLVPAPSARERGLSRVSRAGRARGAKRWCSCCCCRDCGGGWERFTRGWRSRGVGGRVTGGRGSEGRAKPGRRGKQRCNTVQPSPALRSKSPQAQSRPRSPAQKRADRAESVSAKRKAGLADQAHAVPNRATPHESRVTREASSPLQFATNDPYEPLRGFLSTGRGLAPVRASSCGGGCP